MSNQTQATNIEGEFKDGCFQRGKGSIGEPRADSVYCTQSIDTIWRRKDKSEGVAARQDESVEGQLTKLSFNQLHR